MWRSMFIGVVIGAALIAGSRAIPFRDPGDLASTITEGDGAFGLAAGNALLRSAVISKGDAYAAGTVQPNESSPEISGPMNRKERIMGTKHPRKRLELKERRHLQFLYFIALMKAAKNSGD